MDLQALKQQFEQWESQATTQQEEDREANAVSNVLLGINAIMRGKTEQETSLAITKHSLDWLRENAKGENAHRQIEIPVYEAYVNGLQSIIG